MTLKERKKVKIMGCNHVYLFNKLFSTNVPNFVFLLYIYRKNTEPKKKNERKRTSQTYEKYTKTQRTSQHMKY